jgi:hypothetical protein
LDFRARPNGWVKTDPIDVRQGYAPPLTQPVPGWYLDPSGRHRSRFWDGERWRDRVDGSARFKRSFERHTGRMLRGLRPADRVDVERRRIALDLLADVRRIDDPLEALGKRIGIAVVASGTAVTDVYGIGPWAAAVIVGHTGDVHGSRALVVTTPAATRPHPSKRHPGLACVTGSTRAGTVS